MTEAFLVQWTRRSLWTHLTPFASKFRTSLSLPPLKFNFEYLVFTLKAAEQFFTLLSDRLTQGTYTDRCIHSLEWMHVEVWK